MAKQMFNDSMGRMWLINLLRYSTTLIISFIFSFVTNANAKIIDSKPPGNLTIFSEANMTYPLTEIARLYAQENHTVVSIDFNYSFELIQNIDAGEPADVFISSHPDWIETLKRKGLVDVYNLSNIAKDKLVLVTSKNNQKIDKQKIQDAKNTTNILQIIHSLKVPLIVDSEYTSLGRYTKTILQKANIRNQNIFHKFIEDKKSIMDFLSKNNEYCGIILESSLKNYHNLSDDLIALAEIPNSTIYYQALVVAGDNMDNARDFLKFIKSNKTKNILSSKGFIVK